MALAATATLRWRQATAAEQANPCSVPYTVYPYDPTFYVLEQLWHDAAEVDPEPDEYRVVSVI